jgi:hypothetical protein
MRRTREKRAAALKRLDKHFDPTTECDPKVAAWIFAACNELLYLDRDLEDAEREIAELQKCVDDYADQNSSELLKEPE